VIGAGAKIGRAQLALAVISLSLPFVSVVSAHTQKTPDDCKVTQTKKPPYVLTITCHPDCRHVPKLKTVAELVAAGIDPEAAPGVVSIQTGYWRRACPSMVH